MPGMKSCLAGLLIVIILGSIVITMAYHASVNSELRFEMRDSHVEYINTRRSYRPPKIQQGHPAPPTPTAAGLEFDDEETAVEADEN